MTSADIQTVQTNGTRIENDIITDFFHVNRDCWSDIIPPDDVVNFHAEIKLTRHNSTVNKQLTRMTIEPKYRYKLHTPSMNIFWLISFLYFFWICHLINVNIPLSDSSLICTVPTQCLGILDTIIVITFNILTFNYLVPQTSIIKCPIWIIFTFNMLTPSQSTVPRQHADWFQSL